MRRNIFIVITAAVIFALACPAAQAFTYSGAWEPTDGDVNEIKLDLFIPGSDSEFDLYIYGWENGYDWGNANSYMKVLDKTNPTKTIYFTIEADDYYYAGLSLGAKTLSLGVNPYYGIFFTRDSNLISVYEITKGGDPGTYKLFVTYGGNSDTVIQVDAAPIPLPGSVLLLGTGLLGLALLGFRGKKRPL